MPRRREAEEPASSAATTKKKVTWRLHLPGAPIPPSAQPAGTDFAASCQQADEQQDDFCAVEPGREDSFLVQELRAAHAHAADSGVVDGGALVEAWVEGLVSRLTSAVQAVVAASNYNVGLFDTGGVSTELRQTVEAHGSDGVHSHTHLSPPPLLSSLFLPPLPFTCTHASTRRRSLVRTPA